MRNPWKKEETKLDQEIDRVLVLMKETPTESPEYEVLLAQLERLTALREETPHYKVTPDALVTAGSNLLGILVIVLYEHGHVMTSKAYVPFWKNK